MPMLTIDRDAESSVFVEESFWQHKTEVNEKFAERWTELMPADKPPPNMEHFLEFMALDLQDTRERMVTAAQEHETELADDSRTRALRREELTKLRDNFVEMRGLYASVYGQKEAEVMGFDFRTEEVPRRLARQVGTVLLSLKKLPDEPILSPEGKEHLALTPSDVITVLEAPKKALAEINKKVVVLTRMLQRTQKTKDESHDRHVATFDTHAKCGETIYLMVGLDREATQIKPSTRRPGRREVVVEEAAGEDAPEAVETHAEDAAGTPAAGTPDADEASKVEETSKA